MIRATAEKTIIDLTEPISVILSNESQSFSTNSNRLPLSNASYYTDVIVYRGSNEITDFVIGNVSSANGITVGANNSRITFSVKTSTTITADSGTFIIPITVDEQVIEKTFSWSCSKQGNTGQSAVTYFLEPSTLVIKKGYDDTFSPTTVTFSSYSRIGSSTTRTSYAGRFIISESTDGTTFTAKYTSSTNESSKVYTPSSVNIKTIKCVLYASGGTTSSLDTQSVVILTDVENIQPELDNLQDQITTNKTSISTVSSEVDAINKKIVNMVTQDDIESSINDYDKSTTEALRTRISKTEQDIGGIKTTVSDVQSNLKNKADSSTVQSLNSKVTTIETTVNGINTSVSNNYTELRKDIDNLEIGGRNLLINSSKYRKDTPYTKTSEKIDGIFLTDVYMPCENGVIYTFQCCTDAVWGKHVTDGTATGWTHIYLYLQTKEDVQGNTSYTKVTSLDKNQALGLTGKQTWTVTIPENDGNEYVRIKIRFDIHSDGTTPHTVKWWDLKAERGNKATDWTPAPEDVDAEIAATQKNIDDLSSNVLKNYATKSEVSQTANSITTSVSSTYATKKELNTTNTNVTNAQNTANTAQSTADSKAKVFTTTPTVPYKVGDLWVQGNGGDVMKCKTARSSGSYTASDWEKASKYTDDTKANSVDSKVTTLTEKVNVTVKDVKVYYAINTSSTTAPTSGWSTTPPTWENGKYIWSKTTTTLTNGTSTTTNPVCITGAKGATGATGAKGDKGDTGSTGKGIKSITNYYLATSSSSGVTTSTSGWTTTVQSVSSSKKYLWNYEKVTYTDNTTSSTTPCIIGAYGDTGSTGATGKGIKSIVEYYAVSSSNTTAPTSWSTTMQNTTTTNKYLWNYEVITYTDNSTTNTTKKIIGTHGATGAKGDTGATGTGITSITTEYYLSTSKTSQTGGSWVTTQPAWSTGKYLWTRSKIVYKNPTSTAYTTPVCDSSWDAINDIEVGGRNLWQNGNFSMGAEPVGNVNIHDNEFELIDLDAGNITGHSKALHSTTTNSRIIFNRFVTDTDELIGKTLTMQCWIKYKNITIGANNWNILNIGKYALVYTLEDGTTTSVSYGSILKNVSKGSSDGWIHLTGSIKFRSDVAKVKLGGVWIGLENAAGGEFWVTGIKLEYGNKATDWTPSPEDIDAELADANAGKNKWKVQIYPKSTLPDDLIEMVTVDFLSYGGVYPSNTYLIDDTQLSTSFPYSNSYIGYAITRLNIDKSTSVNTTFSIKSSGLLYVNNTIVEPDSNGKVTFTLLPGWNTLEVVWNVSDTDATGGFQFGTHLSKLSACSLMNCLYESVTANITNSIQKNAELQVAVGAIQTQISEINSEIVQKADGSVMTEIQERLTESISDLNGFKQTVSETYISNAYKTEVSSQFAQMLEEINMKVSTAEMETAIALTKNQWRIDFAENGASCGYFSVNKNGITVAGEDGSGYKTVMSSTEFAGYFNNSRVFWLNQDETVSMRLRVDKGIDLRTIKLIPVTQDEYRGLDFLGGNAII